MVFVHYWSYCIECTVVVVVVFQCHHMSVIDFVVSLLVVAEV
jgi:hypothetical protein